MDDNAAAPGRPHPASWPNHELTIANLGHAILLMNFFGVRVLSDPSLFPRVGLAFDSIFTIGPKRMTPPTACAKRSPAARPVRRKQSRFSRLAQSRAAQFIRGVRAVFASDDCPRGVQTAACTEMTQVAQLVGVSISFDD
jgi:hypothetical protein